MSWVPLAVTAWLLGSLALALLIGLGIRAADRLAHMGADLTDMCADVPPADLPSPREGDPRSQVSTAPPHDSPVERHRTRRPRRRSTLRSENRH